MNSESMNAVLKQIYDSDRADHADPRIAGTKGYDDLRSRDSERRKQVHLILRNNNATNCVDQFHAAWVLNHGDCATDAELAYRLAEQSLNGGYEPAKWLYAAAYDRCCMYKGQPQKFGTQIVPDGERYRIWDTETGTTDEQREQFNVPTISEMKKRAAHDTLTMKQPPMEQAPVWLRDAIVRWNSSGSSK